MTIDFNRQRYFRFNNLWHLEKEGNDSNLMPFDPNLYPDGYSEFRNSTPEHWMPKWSGEQNDPSARILDVYDKDKNM